MNPDEYLEKLFTDAFKREFDQDENVVRSLPFFATALALAVTVLSLIGDRVLLEIAGLWSPRFYLSIVVIFLLCCTAWCLGSVLWYIFAAIRARTYKLPPSESDLLDWAGRLRSFYAAKGLAGSDLDAAIITDLRQTMISEYAEATESIRFNNARKAYARNQALSRLIAGLAFAFTLVAVIFIEERLTQTFDAGGSHIERALSPAAIKPAGP
jgi:hypothetical protein